MNPLLFQVLSEQNRIHIIELLRTGAKPVNEITKRLKLNQPQVSKHLRVLSAAGIVSIHPLAQQRFYQLEQKPFQELAVWLGSYESLWTKQLNRLEILLKKEVKDHGGK